MSLLQKTDKWLMKATVADVKNVLIEALVRPEAQDYQLAQQQDMLRYLSNLYEIGEGNAWHHADNEKWKNVYEEAYGECSSFKLALLLAVDYKEATEAEAKKQEILKWIDEQKATPEYKAEQEAHEKVCQKTKGFW